MADLIQTTNPLLRTVIIRAYIAGFCIAVLGVILIYLGATGDTEFLFFGQTFKSTNVGISAIFIGGASLVLLVRRALKSVDSVVTHEATYRASQRERPRLEVTDVVVNDYNPDFTAIIDFRVINRGGKSLTISRVRFEVVDVKNIHTAGALDFSAKYDLDISDLKQEGDCAEVVVSHVLSADEADRFAIVLTAKKMPMGVFRIWVLTPILITSEGQVVAPMVSVGLPWNIRKTSRHPGM